MNVDEAIIKFEKNKDRRARLNMTRIAKIRKKLRQERGLPEEEILRFISHEFHIEEEVAKKVLKRMDKQGYVHIVDDDGDKMYFNRWFE
ncbi:MAG: hypothetical protein ACOC80_16740 [Petrotogales bacterium]